MRVEEQKMGAVLVLKPTGTLGGDEATEFRAQLHATALQTMGRYVLDASGLAFVDSTGLEVLLEASEQLARGGKILKICGANATLCEVLDLTGLTESFERYDELNSAVRSFL